MSSFKLAAREVEEDAPAARNVVSLHYQVRPSPREAWTLACMTALVRVRRVDAPGAAVGAVQRIASASSSAG